MSARRTVTVLLLVAAVVLFILAGLGAVGTITWSHWQALGWWGLACTAGALLPL